MQPDYTEQPDNVTREEAVEPAVQSPIPGTPRFHLYEYLADETAHRGADGLFCQEIPKVPFVNEGLAGSFAELALQRVRAVCRCMALGNVPMATTAFYSSMVSFHLFWKYRCGVPIQGTIEAWAAIYATGTEKIVEELTKVWDEAVRRGMPSLDDDRRAFQPKSPGSTSESTAG